MNAIAVLIISGIVLIILIIFAIVLVVWDWKGWLLSKIGNNYRHGLAHIKVGLEWVYEKSELFYPGDDAMSYNRVVGKDKAGRDIITTDILPNSIGFEYDRKTGRRVYRMQPGGSIATADNSEKPPTDYPSELISIHVVDRGVSKYVETVSALKKSNAGLWFAIIILILALVFGGLFVSSKINAPKPVNTGNTTQQSGPAPSTAPPDYSKPSYTPGVK